MNKKQETPMETLITYLTWRKNIWSESLLDKAQIPDPCDYKIPELKNDDQCRGYIKGLAAAITEAEKLK